MGEPHGVGVVGLGVILDAYLTTLAEHPGIRIAAVADLDASRAEAVAARLPGTRASTVDELGKLVVAQVQNVPGITRTLTCPVVHL